MNDFLLFDVDIFCFYDVTSGYRPSIFHGFFSLAILKVN